MLPCAGCCSERCGEEDCYKNCCAARRSQQSFAASRRTAVSQQSAAPRLQRVHKMTTTTTTTGWRPVLTAVVSIILCVSGECLHSGSPLLTHLTTQIWILKQLVVIHGSEWASDWVKGGKRRGKRNSKLGTFNKIIFCLFAGLLVIDGLDTRFLLYMLEQVLCNLLAEVLEKKIILESYSSSTQCHHKPMWSCIC